MPFLQLSLRLPQVSVLWCFFTAYFKAAVSVASKMVALPSFKVCFFSPIICLSCLKPEVKLFLHSHFPFIGYFSYFQLTNHTCIKSNQASCWQDKIFWTVQRQTCYFHFGYRGDKKGMNQFKSSCTGDSFHPQWEHVHAHNSVTTTYSLRKTTVWLSCLWRNSIQWQR